MKGNGFSLLIQQNLEDELVYQVRDVGGLAPSQSNKSGQRQMVVMLSRTRVSDGGICCAGT
jgi:hypothetical protein